MNPWLEGWIAGVLDALAAVATVIVAALLGRAVARRLSPILRRLG